MYFVSIIYMYSVYYTETYCDWNNYIISGHCAIIVTCIHMDMAIVVHKCGRGGKCLHKLTYTYASFTQIQF